MLHTIGSSLSNYTLTLSVYLALPVRPNWLTLIPSLLANESHLFSHQTCQSTTCTSSSDRRLLHLYFVSLSVDIYLDSIFCMYTIKIPCTPVAPNFIFILTTFFVCSRSNFSFFINRLVLLSIVLPRWQTHHLDSSFYVPVAHLDSTCWFGVHIRSHPLEAS